MALLPEKIDDFVELTLNRFEYDAWTDLSLEYPEYIYPELMRQFRKNEEGGPHIQFEVKVRNSGNWRQTGLYAPDQTDVRDVMINGKVPWKMQTGNFSYDIYEDAFQSNNYQTIVKLLRVREHDMLTSGVEHNEEQIWSAPDGPTDELNTWGIPAWIVMSPTVNGGLQQGAHVGGNPAAFPTGIAGINSDVYPRWRNWAFGYRKVTRDDFVKKAKRAQRYTRFRAPIRHKSTDMGMPKHCAYTTLNVVEELEELAEDRNDNLGKDVARYMDEVTVGGVPYKHVFHLTETAVNDPVYGMNWQKIRPVVKRGCFEKRHKPERSAKQHTVREVHMDSFWNLICKDRRSLYGAERVTS